MHPLAETARWIVFVVDFPDLGDILQRRDKTMAGIGGYTALTRELLPASSWTSISFNGRSSRASSSTRLCGR